MDIAICTIQEKNDSQLLEQDYIWVKDKSILGLDIGARNGESEFIVFLFLIGNIIPNGYSIWDFIRLETVNDHNSSCSDPITCVMPPNLMLDSWVFGKACCGTRGQIGSSHH